jgi:hypothetical protein
MLTLGRAPNAAAGSIGWEVTPKATVAIWVPRMIHSNRLTDIDFFLEQLVTQRLDRTAILAGPGFCAMRSIH